MIAGIIISIVSVIIGVAVILLGWGSMSSTGSFIVLSILGAPLTFLHRIFWIFDRSSIPLFGMYFLYFLQYQLLAFGIYKYYDKLNIKIYSIVIGIIVVSAILMYYFQLKGRL